MCRRLVKLEPLPADWTPRMWEDMPMVDAPPPPNAASFAARLPASPMAIDWFRDPADYVVEAPKFLKAQAGI